MRRRFVSIWYCQLLTDWWIRRQPELRGQPFVLAAPDHGRMIITAASQAAQQQGISAGMSVADARALVATLQVFDNIPGSAVKLLTALGHWCIRYTPVSAIDPPDGLMLDVSGCAHLWGGEVPYLRDIFTRLKKFGYTIRIGIADSPGAAWAVARYGSAAAPVIPPGEQLAALLPFPPDALRLEPAILEKLRKLGLYQISSFIDMPRSALRRRFGNSLLLRLDQALNVEDEIIHPLQPPEAFREWLPSLEPIRTATGIGIALKQLLDLLCERLAKEGKGLRTVVFKCYRIDGEVSEISIGTNRPSHQPVHLFRLFEEKIPQIAPALGIELFVLEALKVEDTLPSQDVLWKRSTGLEDTIIAELLDRITNKMGADTVRRYLPDQHHWPERSIRITTNLQEKTDIGWRTDRPRPIRLLPQPELVEVAAPIPDYPPMLFIYQGKVHRIKKADGPERIEREWWLEAGEHRDYYTLEDEEGRRYWIFRLGHYDPDTPARWFIHGFFA
ncbi:Y-family DNA polymerase [Chitinophaga arvensicola]|uniref:Protein ImuB n=1 Tax=Chitinophaga arvensicola TaxID=29529 RepID=A0A1I0SB50_9BACT|nr:DNA polymerase Y family protein [Chitinophaga arvensicola]SEW53779.1 protein ImuB [Chitinophaga arvensicola]